MKKINYFDFLKREEVTIREILEEKESTEENLTYFVVRLDQTEEKIKIQVETNDAKLIKRGISLFCTVEKESVKGNTLWKSGFSTFGIKLP